MTFRAPTFRHAVAADLKAQGLPCARIAALMGHLTDDSQGHYVTEDLRQRADDVVWRIRYGEQWIYLYLLIEFQSQEDWHMALRMGVYVGLLYQDLLKQGVISPKEPLPPVLPIVLYNGSRRWKAPQNLEALQYPDLPPFLAQWQPRMAYLLIDQAQ